MSKPKETNVQNSKLDESNIENIDLENLESVDNLDISMEVNNNNSILDSSILSKPRSSLDKIRAEICESSEDEVECEVDSIEEEEDIKERKKDYEVLNTKWALDMRPKYFEEVKSKVMKNLEILSKIKQGDKLYVYDGYLHKDDRYYFQSVRRYSEGSSRVDLIVPIINTYHHCFIFKNEMSEANNYKLILDSLDGLDKLITTYPDFQELVSIVNFVKYQFLQTYRVMRDESVQFNKRVTKKRNFVIRICRYIWKKMRICKRRNLDGKEKLGDEMVVL